MDGNKRESKKPANKNSTTKVRLNKTLPPHRRRCIIIKDAKHRGEWTELVFMSRATERGFNVSKPWGDSSRYDCSVERGGRFLRVQVKSTIARQFNGYIVTIKSRCQYYTHHQVDFFAVYVIPEDVWYMYAPAWNGPRRRERRLLRSSSRHLKRPLLASTARPGITLNKSSEGVARCTWC